MYLIEILGENRENELDCIGYITKQIKIVICHKIVRNKETNINFS